jgi:hypothetical protein
VELLGLPEECVAGFVQMRARGFRVLNDVVFNQVLIAGDTPDHTAAILQRLQQSGECWCGSGRWQNAPVIRVSVCSWATTLDDIDRTVAAFVAARGSAS